MSQREKAGNGGKSRINRHLRRFISGVSSGTNSSCGRKFEASWHRWSYPLTSLYRPFKLLINGNSKRSPRTQNCRASCAQTCASKSFYRAFLLCAKKFQPVFAIFCKNRMVFVNKFLLLPQLFRQWIISYYQFLDLFGGAF